MSFEVNRKKAYDEYLEQKWGKLCENHNDMPNINSDRERREMQLLLENSCAPYFQSIMDTGTSQTTTTTAINTNPGAMVPAVLPPILRRLYPSLMIRELVSVQPIPVPDCKVFFRNTKLTGSGSEVPNYTAAGRACATANTYSDVASSTEGTDAIKSITGELEAVDVHAQIKKLKSIWSRELEQDLMNYVGLSAQNEAVADIAQQIGLELESAVITALLASASAGNTDWHYTVPSGTAQSEKKAWEATLYEAFIDADIDVFEKRFVNTNWILADTRTVGRLRKLGEFVLSPTFDPRRSSIQRSVLGTLANQWTIIQDPWFMTNKAILGYKNPDKEFHAGFVFAPYILAYMTKPFENPDTMKTTIGFMSRFALKMLMGDMYSTVTISA